MKLRLHLGLALVACLLALPTNTSAGGKGKAKGNTKKEAVTKASTFKDPGVLKVPEGLEGDFTVAKTVPEIDFCFFGDLTSAGKGTLWSSWGDGLLASNGKYYTSIGDHLGIDARTYIYKYDPENKMMFRVVDVLRAIAHMLGIYGHGKVHAAIHEGKDGKLYIATYWGKHREIEKAFATGKYDGSILFTYDLKTGDVENLGAIVPKQGLPASHMDPERQLIYYFSVYKGDIAVFDIETQKVKFLGGGDKTAIQRTFMRDNQGRVYFSAKDGNLGYYDPAKNKLFDSKFSLPEATSKGKGKGNTLRAAITNPAKDGTIYGMTSQGNMFAFHPGKESMKDLGPNFLKGDYTAVMALSPDQKYLYYAPGAHGSGSRTGVPVVQYNIATGQRKVIAFLKETLQRRFKYHTGGTYNLQLDDAGERLFITFNGAPLGERTPFGKPSVVVVHIPNAER